MFGVRGKIILAVCMVVATAVVCWATVSPPPVNQILGVPDTVFNNLKEADCRVCHEDPDITGPESIPNRHHLLVGQPLADPTIAPFVEPGDTTYQCLACHPVVETSPGSGIFEILVISNCTECHVSVPGDLTVHHRTDVALARHCSACHGSLVNDYDDGHYIPSYDPSLVTPWPSGKPNSGPEGEGNCNFCHAPGTDVAPGSNTGLVVITSNATHHNTGYGAPQNTQFCDWCHDTLAPAGESIRRCEDCHGPSSLHNIQVDSPNLNNLGVIDPGAEDPGWGHIGTDEEDCWGCHGFTALSAAPGSGPVTPNLGVVSPATVTAGAAVEITLTGSAFTNIMVVNGQTYSYASTVELTAADGTVIPLTPSAQDADTLTVSLPAGLATGNHEIRLVKSDKISNVLNLSVLPLFNVTKIICKSNKTTIKGTGFSMYMNASNSGTGLTGLDRYGNEIDGVVTTWNDTKITAAFTSCPSSITVNSIWGEVNKRGRISKSRR